MASGRTPGGTAVRQFGDVPDVNGVRVHVGVDCDAVTIGRYRLDAGQRDEFIRAYFEAERQAEAWAAEHGS